MTVARRDRRASAAATARRLPTPRTGVAWVQCQQQLRWTVGTEVICPLGGIVTVDDCLGCHLLETVDEERSPRMSCSVFDG